MTSSTAALRRLLVVATGIVLAAGTALIGAGPALAQENPSGFVRLGHLAPEVGPVDVYLAPFDGAEQAVITKAPYGTLTEYQTVNPGDYTVSMRPAGAPADSAPMLSTSVTVAEGAAYTVLGTENGDTLRTQVIDDDLTPPPAGQATVRLIQGSTQAPELTVTAAGGPTLARDVAYGAATGYADVPQGRWNLRVETADGSDAMADAMADAPVVDLAAGSVNTLLVVDAADGGFDVVAVLDAAGIDAAAAPQGGVETGAGGTAAPESSRGGELALGGALTLGGLALGAAALRRRTVRLTP